MSMNLSRTGPIIFGAILLVAVVIAGCTSPSGPAPVTTQATTVPTAVPTPATTTRAPATTAIPPTVATTPPVATTPAAPTTTSPPSPVAITIQNFAFVPASVTVPTGTMVIWTNQDSAPHTVVSDATPLFSLGAIFSSSQLMQGQSYSFTFSNAGTYAYHCGIHPFMKGTVTVT
jgi:plastocyanin